MTPERVAHGLALVSHFSFSFTTYCTLTDPSISYFLQFLCGRTYVLCFCCNKTHICLGISTTGSTYGIYLRALYSLLLYTGSAVQDTYTCTSTR
jgi:hypothetical protein